MIEKLKPLLLTAAVVSAGLVLSPAQAQSTDTATMPVTITIEEACDVDTIPPTTLDFGVRGVLNTNVDSTSVISVTCTTGTVFNIGLDGGTSSDINARTMVNGAEFVGYQLYTEAGRTDIWGNTVATDTVEDTGTGVLQEFTVFGRVPPQNTPSAGVYTDNVGVTVTY